MLRNVAGDIDRDEWRDTIEFYLELKQEEREMHDQLKDRAEFMTSLRLKKLEELSKTAKSMRVAGKSSKGWTTRLSNSSH